jgi:nucleoside-diphosphate-sugar epimerase
MSNLIIGGSSQLSLYFPPEYDRISSRNIDYSSILEKRYDSIYLTFAEQRTFLKEEDYLFEQVNFDYTVDVINRIKDKCNRVVLYSTSELWNRYNGPVSLDMPFFYNPSAYIRSKELLCNYINERRDLYENVVIIYPFNFNSPYRRNGFLFSKIFDSLINGSKNLIGSLAFRRDMIHPSIIVKHSITSNSDLLIGGGELVDMNFFVRDLFNSFDLNYEDYISSQNVNNFGVTRNEYFSSDKYSDYSQLLNLTINDVKKYPIS